MRRKVAKQPFEPFWNAYLRIRRHSMTFFGDNFGFSSALKCVSKILVLESWKGWGSQILKKYWFSIVGKVLNYENKWSQTSSFWWQRVRMYVYYHYKIAVVGKSINHSSPKIWWNCHHHLFPSQTKKQLSNPQTFIKYVPFNCSVYVRPWVFSNVTNRIWLSSQVLTEQLWW